MPSWQGKSKGTPLGYRIFVGVLKNFGVTPAYVLLRLVAFYYFVFSRKSSGHAFHYFRQRQGFGRWKSLVMLYRNYYIFGQSIIDKVVVMAGIPNRFTFHFEGEENLRRMVSAGKGGLMLSAHVGNWEVAGYLLKRLDTRINIVMFDGEHRHIKDYLESVTGKRNVHIIVIKQDLSHIYEIMEAFRNNELVCMHADRYLEGNKTLTAGLLGEQAKFPMGPFLLASRFRVPVSFVFAMKKGKLHYHLSASEGKEYVVPAGGEPVMQQMLNEFAGEMEKQLKRYPAQWYNYYNFWQS